MPVTASASTHQYHLDLQQQKENVFVTQLNERTEDDNIRRFPIVKESADKLLQSGINTLQKTSLLRQAVEVEHVDKELAEKREEFRKRMEVCVFLFLKGFLPLYIRIFFINLDSISFLHF